MISLTSLCLGLLCNNGLETHIFRRVASAPNLGVGPQTEPKVLNAGKTLSDALSAGEVRTYTLSLSAGQHVNLELKKADAQLIASICDPQKQRCLNVLGRRFGSLQLYVSTDVATTYQIDVKSIETDVTQRPYELLVSEIGPDP